MSIYLSRIIKINVLFSCLFFTSFIYAGEGMWLPHLLKMLNEKEMKQMGMKISADDIYSINKGSLKDAVVHFGGFCTSEIISPKGLLLTNHHCGYGQIQSHSSLENNIIRNGFWAKNLEEELPNPGLTATFIDYIEDVSAKVLDGVNDQMSASERQALIEKNISSLRKTYTLESYQDVVIRPFYDGNQYFAFVTTTYRDVRLVGAPPESIGKFGSDTDNWVWPRHTGDFALFRIYADKNNKPADYSKDNIPYTPKHFLPISLDGVSEGDFTMVFGFPGRTTQYLPSSAVKQIVEVLNPARISIRETSLSIMDKYMRADEMTKIKYASKYASLANSWKKWIGENLGLKQTDGIGIKIREEQEFLNRLGTDSPYKTLIDDQNALYRQIEPFALAREYYLEISQRNVELLSLMGNLQRLVSAYEKNGDSGYTSVQSRLLETMPDFFKNLDVAIDGEKFGALLTMYVNNLDNTFIPAVVQRKNINSDIQPDYNAIVKSWISKSNLSGLNSLTQVLQMAPKEAVEAIKNDTLYKVAYAWNQHYNEFIAKPYNDIKKDIDLKQAQYTKAQLEVFKDKVMYPDANSTMRVTYGKVNGYVPRDAVNYTPVTYLEGVMEKYKPGDYEFDVPAKLIELHKNRDYGPYKDKSGKLPVCFIGSNHTTGGNSGSPAIDAHGNLIGLNFDRVWEGTMSDIHYDASICRNIMVDARYILFIIDKFAGASHLVKEMKLVHPKKR
jgi:hypothetical protein